jgi:hypothetical protein
MIFCIRRREFIAVLGSAAVWPLSARAQQGDRMRRIGVLVSGDENDPVWKPRLSAFTQELSDLGWTDGRNVRTRIFFNAIHSDAIYGLGGLIESKTADADGRIFPVFAGRIDKIGRQSQGNCIEEWVKLSHLDQVCA